MTAGFVLPRPLFAILADRVAPPVAAVRLLVLVGVWLPLLLLLGSACCACSIPTKASTELTTGDNSDKRSDGQMNRHAVHIISVTD